MSHICDLNDRKHCNNLIIRAGVHLNDKNVQLLKKVKYVDSRSDVHRHVTLAVNTRN